VWAKMQIELIHSDFYCICSPLEAYSANNNNKQYNKREKGT